MTDDTLMRSAQLTPEYRPLASFQSAYSATQGLKGWQYGYRDTEQPANSTQFLELAYFPDDSGQLADGKWLVNKVRQGWISLQMQCAEWLASE